LLTFVDELELFKLGYDRVEPAVTGRPCYHPSVLLKLNIYCYLNRIQSSRRLEKEAPRNVELMWLTGRLTPNFKTISNFRKDNGKAIRGVCRQFVVLCQQLGLFQKPWWLSTAVSLRRSTIVTEILPVPSWCGA
jgi:transposase